MTKPTTEPPFRVPADPVAEASIAWTAGMEPGLWASLYAPLMLDSIRTSRQQVKEAGAVVSKLKRLSDMAMAFHQEVVTAEAECAAVLPKGPTNKTPTAARLAQWNQALQRYRAKVNLARATYLLGASLVASSAKPVDPADPDRNAREAMAAVAPLLASLPPEVRDVLGPAFEQLASPLPSRTPSEDSAASPTETSPP